MKRLGCGEIKLHQRKPHGTFSAASWKPREFESAANLIHAEVKNKRCVCYIAGLMLHRIDPGLINGKKARDDLPCTASCG